MVVLDVAYIFETCGGAQKLLDLIKKHHTQAPAIATIHMWKHRGSISGEWIVPVIYTLIREGYDLATLMTEDEFA